MAFKLAHAYVQFSAKGVKSVTGSVGRLRTGIMALAGPVGKVGTMLAAFGAGVSIKNMIQLGAQAETMAIQFETLLGSAEKAKQMVDDVMAFAARTPFEQQEIAPAVKMLLGFRVAQSEVIEEMRKLGDMAAISGGSLSELSAIYGKLKSKGRLTMEEMNQLAERGAGSMQDFAEVLGVPIEELPKKIERGQIKFEDFQKVLNALTDDGGRFANGMAKMADTAAGRWSTMTGNVKTALSQVGMAIIKAFDLKGVTSSLAGFAGDFWPRFGQPITEALENIAGVIKGMIPEVQHWSEVMIDSANLIEDALRPVADLLHQIDSDLSLLGVVLRGTPLGPLEVLTEPIREARAEGRKLDRAMEQIRRRRRGQEPTAPGVSAPSAPSPAEAGQYRISAAAGLADRMQEQAGKRLLEKNLQANQRTADAVEQLAQAQQFDALKVVARVPGFDQ